MHETVVDVERVITSHARVFDTDRQAVIGTTDAGIIVYWNAAAARIYGWQRAEVLGRDVLEVVPTVSSTASAALIMERLRSGRGWFGEFEVRNRGGDVFSVQVSDLPVYDRDGSLIGIVGISRPSSTGD